VYSFKDAKIGIITQFSIIKIVLIEVFLRLVLELIL